ncbi:hypothetical protein BG000_001219 [Podila horticola]|nr:hypothetical protein BG003_008718 [Podila horticola]KAG0326845.1 hypothetical protein BG000_001219 [Podila horticola]
MSSSANTSRGTQYTVLNASLEKLKKNLEVLEANVEQTMVQSEWAKQLAVIHSSLFMASSRVLKDEFIQHEDDPTPQHDDDRARNLPSDST